MSVEVSHDPRSGLVAATAVTTTTDELERVVTAAATAAPMLAAASPQQRQGWIAAVADEMEAHVDELARLADWETGLGTDRLRGEIARTVGQLRYYAAVAVEGSHLEATIDTATDATPLLARVNVPLGPVAVFGASNFPFAYSVVGTDTAAAWAAGCPVVVKGHPAHLAVSRRVHDLAAVALHRAGAPAGMIGMVLGFEAGRDLVQHPGIAAVGFTGSQAGGMALWRLAHERAIPIPVFAEMGTVNPVVVSPAAATDLRVIAEAFVASFTMGAGQFCTKPGLLLVPRGLDAAQVVADSLGAASPSPVMLTQGISSSLRDDLVVLQDAGATVVTRIDGPAVGWGAPAAVLSAPADLLVGGSRLLGECFGPVVLVVEYQDVDEAEAVVGRLQGTLAGSVFASEGDTDAERLLAAVTRKVGRVILNGWPTGVAFTWAQHHGGPWPATTNPSASSVGAGALGRFVRPVAHQNLDDHLLPPSLQAGNPWGITRWVDGRVQPGSPR